MINLKKATPLLQFSALAVCVLFFFLTTADSVFTVHDDIVTYMQVQQGDLWNTILSDAKHGRVCHIILLPLLYIPYFFDSIPVIRVFSALSVIFNMTGLYQLIKKNVDKNSAFLCTLLFISFACISNQHNLFVSYTLAHQIPIGLILFSLVHFTDYYREEKTSSLIISAILFTSAAMLYESMAAYIILFILIAMYKSDGNIFSNLSKILYNTHFHILFLLLYLVIYLAWRHMYPSDYDGAKLYFGNIPQSIITMVIYTLGMTPGLPLGAMILKKYITFSEFIENINIGLIIIPLITAVIFYRYFSKINTPKNSRTLSLFCITAMIIPNIIICFTEKYVAWSQSNSYSYVTSFYSYFFMIPLFLLLLRCVFKGKVKKPTLILLSSLVFVISLASTVGNAAWNTYFKKNLDRYNAFSAIVKDDYFDSIPDGSIIYIPDYNGIHNDMEITKSFAKTYTTRDIYFENKEENLDFSKNIICMRYDPISHAVIIGSIDKSFMCSNFYVLGKYNASLPETVDMKNIF